MSVRKYARPAPFDVLMDDLRAVMRRRGITQRQLARWLGTTEASLRSHLCRGHLTRLTFDIAEALDLDIEFKLWKREESR